MKRKKKFTVLVVDDNLENINLAANILLSKGYNIGVAESGLEALKHVKINEPDLILLDIMMPGMNGLEVCKILKDDDNYKHIPIIFLTANAKKEKIVYALQLGAADYVTKPFDEAELMARVSIHIEYRESQKQLEHANQYTKTILDNTPEPILLYTSDGLITDINTSAKQVLGFSKDEFMGMNIQKLCPGGELSDLATYEHVFKVQNRIKFESIVKVSNGKYLPAEVTTTLVNFHDSTRFLSVFRDLTDQKKAEEELRVEERKYRQLTESMKDVVSTISLSGKVLYVSPSITKFGGYIASEEIGNHITKYVAKKMDLLKGLQVLKEISFNKRSGLFEFLYKPKTGQPFYVELSYSPIITNNKVSAVEIVLRNVSERKKNETILKEYRARLLSIINSIPDFIFAKDINSTYTIGNLAFANYLGIDQKLITNKTDDVLYSDELADLFIKADKEILRTGKDATFAVWTKTPEGKDAFVETRKSLIKSPDGDVYGIVGVARDITKLKRTEETLQTKNNEIAEAYRQVTESEEKYRILFEDSYDAIYIADEGKLIDCNNSVLNMFGYTSKDEVLSCHPSELSPEFQENGENSFEVVNRMIKQAYEKGTSQYEWIHAKANGENFPAEISLTAIPFQDKQIIHAVIRDLTIKKLNEQELEKYREGLEQLVEERTEELTLSEKNFKELFDRNNDAIIINTIDGRILKANKAASLMLEFSRDEMLKLNTADFILNDFDSKRESFHQRLRNGEDVTFETKNITKTGKIIPIEISSTLITYYGEEVLLSAGRNITERIETEREKLSIIVNTEEKERQRFAKDLHDGLGATLSAAKMYMNILKRAEPGSEKATSSLEEAVNLITKASKSAKEIAVNIRPHDLQHFGLSSSLKNFCEKINSIGTIKVNLVLTNFDIRLEEEVELNLFRTINELINNTLKYAEADNIQINLSHHENEISLDYTDNGVGFDYDETMRTKKGTGISNILYRAKLIGGKIQIKSAPWKGMSVNVTMDSSSIKK